MNTEPKNSTAPDLSNTVLADVILPRNIDYDKVRAIGRESYCIKGISCNLCDSIDRRRGVINNCVTTYAQRHFNLKI